MRFYDRVNRLPVRKRRWKVVRPDGNRERVSAVLVRLRVRTVTSPMWSATDAFGSGLLPALACPRASSTLPSEMLLELTVILLVTVVLLGAVNAWAPTGRIPPGRAAGPKPPVIITINEHRCESRCAHGA